MRTKPAFDIAKIVFATVSFALLQTSVARAADVNAPDLSPQAAQSSRAQVAQETERALAAGEIKNGPLVELYTLVEPQPVRLIAQQTLPARKDMDTRVAAAPANPKK